MKRLPPYESKFSTGNLFIFDSAAKHHRKILAEKTLKNRGTTIAFTFTITKHKVYNQPLRHSL